MDSLFHEIKGKRGVRDGQSEFESRVEVGGECDEIDKFCIGAGSSPYAIGDVVERELGSGVVVLLEQRMYNVTNIKSGIVGAYDSAYGMTATPLTCEWNQKDRCRSR